MRGFFLAALAGVASAALSPISRKGAYLFDSSGARFYLKGVAYSANYGSSETPVDPGHISQLDPLANAAGCTRDIPFFKQLGINVIRVYQVNATLSHDACMSALSSAGIYVILDLASPAPNAAINTASPSWNTGLFTSFASTIAAFGSYDNVMGFNVGNEVINNVQDDQAAPYIKAAVRDVKSYLTAHGYSQLVGYAGTDSPNSRVALPDYLACETTEGKDQFDYWGLNIYEWCGTSSFEQSGYKARTDELANLGVPAFFSEYGCNSVTPRTFDDVPVLFSSDMTNVWSGGMVYEYQMESNNFGLVTISADGKTVTPNTDFDNLKSRYTSITPPSLSKDSYSPSGSAPSCPASDPSTWPASTTLPPSPNADVCSCVASSVSCTSTYDSSTDLSLVGKALGTVCGTPGASGVCSDISGNGTTGSYGSLEMCDPLTQLNAVLDKYYASQNNAATACDFGGIAKTTGSGKSGASAMQGCMDKGFKGGVGVPIPSALPAGLSVKPAMAGSTETGTGKTDTGGNGKNGAKSVRVGLLGVFGAVTCGVLLML